MLEIICFGALALTTDLCTSSSLNLATPNAIELNTTATKVHLAGRQYESDYTREAEEIKERNDLRNHRNSDSRQYGIYRDVNVRDGGCVDEMGRIYRNPDDDCSEEIYRTPERRYEERRDRNYRTPQRRYEQRRDRIYREPN